MFGGAAILATKPHAVVYFQDSVAGLVAGAQVTLRGVRIGTVRSMKIYVRLPNVQPVIPVYLEIESGLMSWTSGSLPAHATDFGAAIKAGLRAQLTTQNLLTGQLGVNLDFHPAELPGSFRSISKCSTSGPMDAAY